MEFEIKRSSHTLNIDGTKHEVRKPTMIEIESMQEKLSKPKSKAYPIMCEFAISLGLPKKIVDGLDSDMFTEVINSLSGVKKS